MLTDFSETQKIPPNIFETLKWLGEKFSVGTGKTNEAIGNIMKMVSEEIAGTSEPVALPPGTSIDGFKQNASRVISEIDTELNKRNRLLDGMQGPIREHRLIAIAPELGRPGDHTLVIAELELYRKALDDFIKTQKVTTHLIDTVKQFQSLTTGGQALAASAGIVIPAPLVTPKDSVSSVTIGGESKSQAAPVISQQVTLGDTRSQAAPFVPAKVTPVDEKKESKRGSATGPLTLSEQEAVKSFLNEIHAPYGKTIWRVNESTLSFTAPSLKYRIVPASPDGREVYRALFEGFSDKAKAAGFNDEFRAKFKSLCESSHNKLSSTYSWSDINFIRNILSLAQQYKLQSPTVTATEASQPSRQEVAAPVKQTVSLDSPSIPTLGLGQNATPSMLTPGSGALFTQKVEVKSPPPLNVTSQTVTSSLAAPSESKSPKAASGALFAAVAELTPEAMQNLLDRRDKVNFFLGDKDKIQDKIEDFIDKNKSVNRYYLRASTTTPNTLVIGTLEIDAKGECKQEEIGVKVVQKDGNLQLLTSKSDVVYDNVRDYMKAFAKKEGKPEDHFSPMVSAQAAPRPKYRSGV